MASITPKNGRVNFVSTWDPHTYWELNSTNLGTNYGDDATAGGGDNTNVAAGDISTQESYDGMATQNDPPANGAMDIYLINDAAALVYIPAGLAHGTVRGLWQNGGGTNSQGAFLRGTTTGVEIALAHNNGGDLGDYLIEEIPDADLPGWFCISWQYNSHGGTEGDFALWLNGTAVRSGTRTYTLDYGSGNPDFGDNSGGREPNASEVRDPASYTGGDWAGDGGNINGTGILIANFTCDNPSPGGSDTSAGNGDTWHTDYYDEHVDTGGAVSLTPTDTSQAQDSANTSLTVEYSVTQTDTSQAQDSANTSLTVEYSVALTETSQAQTSDLPAATYTPPSGAVAPTETSQAQASDTTSLAENPSLAATDTSQGQASDDAALTVEYSVALTDGSQAQQSDTTTASVGFSLSATDTTQAQTADATSLAVEYLITLADSSQAQTSDTASLSSGFGVGVTDTSQTQQSDTSSLTVSASITLDDTSQAQQPDTVFVGEIAFLDTDDTAQSQTSGETALSISRRFASAGLTLTRRRRQMGRMQPVFSPFAGYDAPPKPIQTAPTETSQAQTSDDTSVTFNLTVTPSDTSQVQASGTTSLTEVTSVTPGDTVQAQTSGSPSSALNFPVSPDESAQTQASGAAFVTRAYAVTPTDTSQEQISDQGLTTPLFSTTLDSSSQAQTSGTTAVILEFPVTPSDTRQLQASDTTTLTETPYLRPIDTRQRQAPDTTFVPAAVSPAGTYQTQGSAALDVTYYNERESVIRALSGKWWVDVGRNINIDEDDL